MGQVCRIFRGGIRIDTYRMGVIEARSEEKFRLESLLSVRLAWRDAEAHSEDFPPEGANGSTASSNSIGWLPA